MSSIANSMLNPADDAQVTVQLICHSDNSQHNFTASPDLLIGTFLEQILEKLSQGENSERMSQLRECYEPVLELVVNGEGIELQSEQSLTEAGLSDNATCQIAARPLKEKLLFCRYANMA